MASPGDEMDTGGTFMTETGDLKPEPGRPGSPMAMDTLAAVKMQVRKTQKRVDAKRVKRDPKTGQAIKNEWQRDTDIMYYLSSTNVTRIKEEFDRKAEDHGSGLTLVEFVYVMIKCLGMFIINQVDFVVQAVDLFRQVDVDDDGTMTWDEFTSYIVEAGLAQGQNVESQVAVRYRYKLVPSQDHNVHNSFVEKVYRLPAPLACIAAIENGSEMLKLYRPSADPNRAQLKQMKLVRHDTAYSPHEVLTCLLIGEAGLLVTSSQLSVTGPFFLSFWSADTLTLLHRATTQTPQTVTCWSQRAHTFFSAGHGVGAGTSSPINAWSVKTFKKMRSLVWHTSHVTDMVEIPGNVMNFLVSASFDGSMVLWSMRTFRCIDDRVVVAHEFGVRAITYSERLGVLASYGAAGNPSAGKALGCYAVHIWDVQQWLPQVRRRNAATTPRSTDSDGSHAVDPSDDGLGEDRVLPRPKLLLGHQHPVVGVVFQDEELSVGPPHIVSADCRGSVRIWNARTYECFQTLNVVRVPSFMHRRLGNTARVMSRKEMKQALLSKPPSPRPTTRTRRRRPRPRDRLATSDARLKADAPAGAGSGLGSRRGAGSTSELGEDGVGSGGGVEADGSAVAHDGEGEAGGASDAAGASVRFVDSPPRRPPTAAQIMEDAKRCFSPVMAHRTIADEYEVVPIGDDSGGEEEEEEEAKVKAPPPRSTSSSRYLQRLDSILAIPASATAANVATILLCGNEFRMLRLQQIIARPQPLVAAVFNATSFTFITATASRVTVWDAIHGRVLRAYEAASLCGSGADITSLCLDGRKRKFILGDSYGHIRVINFTNGAVMKSLDPHQGVVSSLVYSAEDGCVISTSWDSTVHVCDERPQSGYVAAPAAMSVLLRRAKLPPLGGISALADEIGFDTEAVSLGSFDTDPDDAEAFGTGELGLITPDGGATTRGHSSVDVTVAALSPHLNLIACAARGMDNSYMVLVWRYDKTILRNACVGTGPYASMADEVSALQFLEPYPLLLSTTADGNIFLWGVPPHSDPGVMKAVWSSPPKYRKPITSVALFDTIAHPHLHMRTKAPSVKFGVLGASRSGRGIIVFTGDDSGVIHRWELSAGFLAFLQAPRTKRAVRSTTVERRMGTSLLPQHTLASVVAAVRYSKRLSKLRPVEGAFYGEDAAAAKVAGERLPVWCGCWKAHEDAVSLLQWMPESETLLSGSADGYARIWSYDGLLLGTLDPNPRNQPTPHTDVGELTKDLARKLAREQEEKALSRPSTLPSGATTRPGTSRAPTPATPGSVFGTGDDAGRMQSQTEALMKQAAAAIQARMDKAALRVPAVKPVEQSRASMAKCANMYEFSYQLGDAPPVGAVKWHLKFDLEDRRRRDEEEAKRILPESRLLRTAHAWKRKTFERHKSRRKEMQQALGVLEQHGIKDMAEAELLSDSSDSEASVLMATAELMEAQEMARRRVEEPTGGANGGVDPLLGMLNDISTMNASKPASRRASQDPIVQLMAATRRKKRPTSRQSGRRRSRRGSSDSRASRASRTSRASRASRSRGSKRGERGLGKTMPPASPVSDAGGGGGGRGRLASTAPPMFNVNTARPVVARTDGAPASPFGGSRGGRTPVARSVVGASPKSTAGSLARPPGSPLGRAGASVLVDSPVAESVDSLEMDPTNDYLVNYNSTGQRSRLHRDYESLKTTKRGVKPSYYTQYSHLSDYKSLLPPESLPSSPKAGANTRIRKRKKPTLTEILADSPMVLAAKIRAGMRANAPPSAEGDKMMHKLRPATTTSRKASQVNRRSSSMPALSYRAGARERAVSPLGPGRGYGRPDGGSTAGGGFGDGQYDDDDDDDAESFYHAVGPGGRVRGRRPRNSLRPGLTMFDRNPRSAVDAGGTRYPPILSSKLRSSASSSVFRDMERRWRRQPNRLSGTARIRHAPKEHALSNSVSRLGRSLQS